jgi:uncharacterized alkaline shock family protein YloU
MDMTESLQLDMGTIKIADDVVAKVAGMAALETPGIAAMSGGLSEGFAKRLSGKNVQKGVTVEVGQLEAAIDLRIIVLYETPIHEVCRMLQQNVREAVETLTGLKVVEVNVKVEGVAFKDELIDTDKNRSSNHPFKVM